MYATIHDFPCPTESEGVRDVVAGCLPAGAEPAGLLGLVDVEHPGRGTAVALWADEPDSESRVYRVSDRFRGISYGRRPLFAQVTWLNGEGDPVRADAAERGGRDRIWPAVQQIDGIVEVLALRSRDDRIVVVGLAVGTETYQQVELAVMGTDLLPDENPALLPGPDRVDQSRVLFAKLPTAVRS